MVEAALTLSIALLLILGMMEVGRAFMTYNLLSEAVREGARVAAITPGAGPEVTTAVQNRVNSVLQDGGVTGAIITLSFDPPGDPERGTSMTLKTQVNFEPVAALVFGSTATIPLVTEVIARHE